MTKTILQTASQVMTPSAKPRFSNVLLQARGITKTYRSGQHERVVLDEVDLDIREGEFVSIMGPSGAGKSTLLHVLSALDGANACTVTYKGKPIAGLSEEKITSLWANDFGFVFQQSRLVSNLTVRENLVVAALAGNKKKSAAFVAEQVQRLIERMGLQAVQDNLPSHVSSGEAQRASVARAVVNSPSIVFADEPTGALNRANGDEVIGMLSQLNGEGQTVVMVTHDHRAAMRGNRMVYLRDGNVQGSLDLTALSNVPQKREQEVLAWLGERGW